MIKLDGFETIIVLHAKRHFPDYSLSNVLAVYSGMDKDFYVGYREFEVIASVASKLLEQHDWIDFLTHLSGQNNIFIVKDLDEKFVSINEMKLELNGQILNTMVKDRVIFAELSENIEKMKRKVNG